MAESHLTKEIGPEELTKVKFSLNRKYDVDNENCPAEELDQALEKFYVEVCNFVMQIINNVVPVNSINTGTITPGKIPCLGEAKMAATTINVVNSFSIIFPSYLLFFKKTVSKTRL